MIGLAHCFASSGMFAQSLLGTESSRFYNGHKLSQELSRRRWFQRFHMCQTTHGSRDDTTL